jgi:RND superfamily putative drug exporter
MWITVAIWLAATMLLTVFAPNAKEYEVTSLDSIPEDAQSIIAQEKVDEYFSDNEGIPAILVFQADEGELELTELTDVVSSFSDEDVPGIESIVPMADLPPQAAESFFSEDNTTAIVPLSLDPAYETEDIKNTLEQIYNIVAQTDLTLHVTGPAGIAADTSDLFARADLVLIFSTIGIILVLLIVIYRSPALALIPLLAAGFVYMTVNQLLGLLGQGGLLLSNQSLSIMSILLFASVIDYSLFVFSRYREELKTYENKHEAMRVAMRNVGIPVFYSGATVLAAMLVLFFAQYEDSRNFAPIFGTTMVVVILSSVTLVPALFTIFGRKSFWPLIPRVGDQHVKTNSFWSKVGRMVTRKPVISIAIIGAFLLISAANVLNTSYEFDNLKSFPEDMPSREGYEILEERFEAGDLAPTTVLYESDEAISESAREELQFNLSNHELISNVRIDGVTEDEQVVTYSLTFAENPYSNEVMNHLEEMINDSEQIAADSNLAGQLYFTGETATAIDDRSVNNRDLAVVMILETVLIFVMLIFLTKSFRMPIYMMGTILVSFVAALGLGMFLTELFFGIDSISNRVPMYSFVFLVALGIDYNIILVSRFLEERKKHPVKKAVEVAVANTGGVISSAGLILAATFAVLMTQPIEFLFVFGFIVAVGILMDTFLIRGVLLPGLLVLFEKNKAGETERNK